jgi:hypothetical protein
MASSSITFRVDDSERRELVSRAERDKVSLSDYIRVRLGLRAQGSESDVEVQDDGQNEKLRQQLVDHEQRLRALENDHTRTRAGAS